MDKELKAKWVAALRSGEYEQGVGSLYNKTRDAYCCLGVLHRVADVPDDQWVDCSYGLSTKLLAMERRGLDYELAKMNDNGKTFSEIADYIEMAIP